MCETAYTDRDTAGSLILKLFPELVEGNGREVAASYIKLNLAQSNEAVIPGSRFTVAAEVASPPDTHVYAPEVKGHKPIQLIVEASPGVKLLPVRYPKAKVLFLRVINGSVPVYEGNVRPLQGRGSAGRADVHRLCYEAKTITLKGKLFYQACDIVKCYLPQKSDVSWDVRVIPLDRERSPDAIRN